MDATLSSEPSNVKDTVHEQVSFAVESNHKIPRESRPAPRRLSLPTTAGFIFLPWQKEEGKDDISKACSSCQSRSVPRSSQHAIHVSFATLFVREAFHFSSLLREEGQVDHGCQQTPVVCARMSSSFAVLWVKKCSPYIFAFWGMLFMRPVVMCPSTYRTMSITRVLHYLPLRHWNILNTSMFLFPLLLE